jgi:hypothetical protein
VTLDRVWSLELAGRFLQADMGVRMANGASFRVIAYWSVKGPHRYEAVWLDELGQSRRLEGVGDPALGMVTVHYLEDAPGDEPDELSGWRRMTFRITGPFTYEEVLETETPNGWEEIGRFSFERKADPGF